MCAVGAPPPTLSYLCRQGGTRVHSVGDGSYVSAMRFSWLDANVMRAARTAIAAEPETDEDFTASFELPPAPDGVSKREWPRIAEHVARADRVSRLVALEGLDSARQAFRDSPHAVEVAAVADAALESEEADLDLFESILSCAIDELVAYGAVLTSLLEVGAREDSGRMVELYERFCDAAAEVSSGEVWAERVEAMRGGLANAYVACDRCDDADRVFRAQHDKVTENVFVALSASRTFLAAGQVQRAVDWLGIGADRAHALGRADMEQKLRDKRAALEKRLG